MKPKLLFLSVIFNFAVCTVMSQTTGYLEGPLESCPVNSSLNTYTVKDLPAGCKYSWTVDKGSIYEGGTNKGTTLPASSKLAIDVKWNEESYINDIVAGYNNGHYPVGLVKVVTVGCSDPINNNKFPKDLPVTITSVKGYQIPGITFMGAMRIPNETIDLTTNTSAVIVNCGSLPINYPKTPLGFIRTVYPTGFHWTLPEGWTAAGQSGTSFDAGSYLTLAPPCWGYSLNTLKDLKVKIITPEVCLVNNAYQQGDDFVLHVRKDAPYVISLSPISLNWGEIKSYTVTATTNISTDLQYVWNLPAGFTRTSTGSYGQIITTTPSLDVTTTGCNTSEQVSFKVQNSCGNSIPKTQTTSIIYPTISGPAIVCSSDATFTVNNLTSGHSVSWTQSTNLNLLPSFGSSATFTANGIGIGWVSATINSGLCQVVLPQKPVWVGAPFTPTSISGFCCNGKEFGSESIYEFTVVPVANQVVDQYDWVVSGGTILEGQGTHTITVETWTVTGSKNVYFDVNVNVGNNCGWSPLFSRTGYVTSGSGPLTFYVVYPNPTSSEVAITLKSDNSITPGDKKNKSIKSIRVVDKFGSTRYSKKYGTNTFETKINVSDFPTGVYIIKINEGIDEESHPLVKQ